MIADVPQSEQVSEIPAALQAQFKELQMRTAGLDVELPDGAESSVDPLVEEVVQTTRGELNDAADDLAFPIDKSYENPEGGRQIVTPKEDFATNPLVANIQDTTHERIGSLDLPEFTPDSTTGYSGS